MLRRQQDQNHQGKITSPDHGKQDITAEQWEGNAQWCDAVASTNRVVIQMELLCKLACSRHSLYLHSSPSPVFVRTLSHTRHRHINTLLKGCGGTPRVQRLICRSDSLFISGLQYANCFLSANLIAKPSKGQITKFVFISVIFPTFMCVVFLSAHTGPIITKTMNLLLLQEM